MRWCWPFFLQKASYPVVYSVDDAHFFSVVSAGASWDAPALSFTVNTRLQIKAWLSRKQNYGLISWRCNTLCAAPGRRTASNNFCILTFVSGEISLNVNECKHVVEWLWFHFKIIIELYSSWLDFFITKEKVQFVFCILLLACFWGQLSTSSVPWYLVYVCNGSK